MFLLYGSKGWIGSQVRDIMVEMNVPFTEGTSRCDDIHAIESEIDRVRPTHILATIGRTHGNGINTIDCLEDKDMLKTNIGDNLFSPLVLAHVCKERSVHFTYLGTGCIFNKDEDTHEYKYTEEDDPDFFGSSYSVVKGYSDRMMRLMFNDSALNVRMRMPIVDDLTSERNFLTNIYNYTRICSIPNSMTYLPELLPMMVDMAIKKKTGTINLTNPGVISHNEILNMYKEKVDSTKTWENMTIGEQDVILKSKRSNNWLDTTKLESQYKVKGIREVIEGVF